MNTKLLARGAQTPDHARYLRRKRLKSLAVLGTQIALLVLFLGLWELGARQGWINGFIFSQPSKIWDQLVKMLGDGTLLYHTGITVWETLVGFVLGTLAGTVLAILLWSSQFLSRVLDPYIVIFNSMPKVALGPIFIVAFGQGFLSIVMMALAVSSVYKLTIDSSPSQRFIYLFKHTKKPHPVTDTVSDEMSISYYGDTPVQTG